MPQQNKVELELYEMAVTNLIATKRLLEVVIHSPAIQIQLDERKQLLEHLDNVNEKVKDISG